MTPAQRRIMVGVCLVIGMSLLVSGGLTFLVRPMAEDLGLSDATVDDLLAIPSVAALIMVFSAGQLGDRLGPRRTIVLAAVAFSAGGCVLAVAGNAYVAEIGLAICSAAAVTVQIVGISLLQQATVDGPAHVSAFTTLGAVFPLAFLIFPVATAGALEFSPWQLIPVVWVLAGVVMLTVALLMFEAEPGEPSVGESVTPLLAGIAFAAGAWAIAETDDLRVDPITIAVSAAVCLASGLACYALARRHATPSFTFEPIRAQQLPLLLLAIALVTLAGLLTYVSIALEYLYDLTPYGASLAVIPAQIGAILGARFLARHAIRRWGGVRAARFLMLALAATMLPLVLLSVGSPLWFLAGVATVFSFTWMAVLTVLNAEVMRRAPAEQTGAVSSFRTAASSLGTAVGVGVFGAIIISTVSMDGTTVDLGPEQLIALTNGLRLAGLLASLVALMGWGVLRVVQRHSSPSADHA
ncbi:MAG: hypothetical protein RL134_682 [Actinomycetota bacterium]